MTQNLYAPTDTNPANTGITQTTASWSVGYDATGRLTGFIESTALTTTTGPGTSSFSYDSNGNRLGSLQTATAGTSTISTARTYAVTSGTNKLQGYNQITQTSLGSSTARCITNTPSAVELVDEAAAIACLHNAQRLTGWQDNRNAQGTYTLDAMGSRVVQKPQTLPNSSTQQVT